MAQATSDTDAAPGEDEAGPVHPYVEALTGLPGLEHVAVVDISGRHVLGEWGGPEGSVDPLLERARAAADRSGRRELEDVVSTTPTAFHLSRLVLAGPGHPQSVWVAMRINRVQGSLPWSRAALDGLVGASFLRPQIPAPRLSDDVPGPSGPGPRVVPPPPAPPTAPTAPPRTALPPTALAPTTPPAPTLPPPPAAPAARTHVVLTTRTTVPTPVELQDTSAETAETAIVEVATTVELQSPALSRPQQPPAPPAEGRRSSFAPVLTVLPPPSPVPDDDRTEEPAPMPAPMLVAPDPADQVATEIRDDTDDVADASEVSNAQEAQDAQDDPQAPTDEPRVMRRLIHGMRRR